MVEEANKKIPLETGDLLSGYYSQDNSDVIVTRIVGPGPNATHEEFNFHPDEDFQKERMANIYDENSENAFYLGDWHTHPSGLGRLSRKDKRALKNIARFPENYVKNPVMAIMYGTPDFWELSASIITNRKGKLFYLFRKYTELDVMFFEP